MSGFELEQQYEIVFKNTQDALFIVKVDNEKGKFYYLKLNPTHEKLTGLHTKEIRGKTPEEVIGPEEGRKISEKYQICVDKKDTINYEEELILPEGCKIWSTKLNPVIKDGEVKFIVGSSREITERKKLEEEKEELTRRYKLATRVAGIGVWKMDVNTNELVWDSEMNEIYEVEEQKSEKTYEGWIQAIHPEDRERTRAVFESILDSNEVFDTEFRILVGGNKTKHIRAFGQPVENEQGQVEQVIGVNYDITARKKYERRYKTLFDESLFGVVIIDPGTAEAAEYNDTVCEMLGYTREEFSHLAIGDYEAKESPEETKARIKRIMEGSREKFETRHRKKDGTIIDVMVKANLINLNDKKYIQAMFVDISDKKAALRKLATYNKEIKIKNVELRQARDKAKEATRAKSEFLATMSHEIRTPMNSIIGMAELLEETNLNKQQQKYVDIFKLAGDNLLSLINDILDLSKIEAGRLELEKRNFNLPEIVENTAEMMAVRAHEKELELLLRIAPEVPDFLEGDPERLRQILINLIGNAIKFTEKGEIMVDVSVNRETDISGQSGVELLFSVQDTGIGIAEDKQKSIFSSFTQADSSSTRKYGGTGLGLTISKQLINLMDGEIWLESEPGQGSTFYFTASFIEKQRQADPEYINSNDIVFSELKVMAVDDNSNNLFIISEMLAEKGIEVETVQDVDRAIKILQDKKKTQNMFDILLLDCVMPDKDGFELVEHISKEIEFSNLKIIMLSSDISGKKHKDYELIAGSMMKPVRKKKLFSIIAEVLTNNSSQIRKKSAKSLKDEKIENSKKDVYREIRETETGGRILLVEDIPDNRFLVEAFLKKKDYNLDMATNGQEAVAAFKDNDYDLVLMDIQMPVMDGYQATREIREWESEKGGERTPVLALTAHALEKDIEKALSAGCDDHLGKPIKKKELYQLVDKYIKN